MSAEAGLPPLPAIEMGAGEATHAVLLHGFAGAAISWRGVQSAIAETRPTIAFDLPGHAGARDFPGAGPAKVAARAVLAELDHRGIERAHVVGHSMGGAVAALMALFAAERIASLVLLSPGGFGPEIGVDALRGFSGAGGAADPGAALAAMGAPDWRPDAAVLALHAEIAALQSPARLADIFAILFKGGVQGMLPLSAVAAMGVPVRLVWGDRDAVTPFSQSAFVPGAFRLEVLHGVGHMLMDEAPAETTAMIVKALDAAEKGAG